MGKNVRPTNLQQVFKKKIPREGEVTKTEDDEVLKDLFCQS